MSKVKKILTGNFLYALLIFLAVGLTVSAIGGFRFTYGTNDDYTISTLLSSGDDRVLFISYYIGFIMSRLQQVFAPVNVYAVFQIVLCSLSVLTLNYVMLGRLKKPIGAFLSVLVDIVLVTTGVMVVQFTQTTTLACTAGALLFIYASYHPLGRGVTLFQKIAACLLVLFGSFFRVDSFEVVAIFAFVLLACLIISEASEDKSREKRYKKAAAVIKKRLVFVVSFILIFAICFGLSLLSDVIKRADDNYRAHEEAAHGRALITDYPLANYSKNTEFYNEHGVLATNEVSLINRGHIDKNVLTTDRMTAIGEFSAEKTHNGKSNVVYAIDKTLETVKAKAIQTMWSVYDAVLPFKSILPFDVPNKVYLAGVGLLGAALLAGLIVLYKLLKKRFGFAPLIYGNGGLITLKLLLAAMWAAYFIVYGVTFVNCMMLACCAAALLTIRNANLKHTLFSWVFSFLTVGLYAYQICFRLNFRSVFSFAAPMLFFLLYLFDWENMDGWKRAETPAQLVSTAVAAVLAVVFAVNIQTLAWRFVYVSQTGQYQSTVYDYITAHPDVTYAMIVPCCMSVDPNYNNALLQPDMPENTLLYGSWNMYSDSNEKELEERGIENLFRDMIGNDKLQLMTKTHANFPKYYGVFLNNHYGRDGKAIALEQVDRIDNVGTYWSGIRQGDPLNVYKIVEKDK